MTTTTNHTTNHADDTHDSPTPGKLEKVGSWIGSHLFTIYLFFPVLIASIALTVAGIVSSSAYDYNNTMRVIIGLFNLAIMAYPGYLAIKNWGKYSQAPARLVVILATFVVSFVLLPPIVLVFGRIGFNPWVTAPDSSWIAVVPMVLAPIAHAFAAHLLSRYESKGSDSAATDTAKIPGLTTNITSAEAEFEAAKAAASALGQISKDAKQVYEEFDTESKRLAGLYQDAKQVFDESPAVLDKAELENKLKLNTKEQTSNANAQTAKGIELDRAKTESLKQSVQAEIDELDLGLRKLIIEGNILRQDIEKAVAKVESSTEKMAMDNALAASEPSAIEANTAKEAYDATIKSAEQADREMGAKGAIVETNKQVLADTEARIRESKLSNKGAWRGVIFVPILVLLVTYLLLYPVWYNWIAATKVFIPVG